MKVYWREKKRESDYSKSNITLNSRHLDRRVALFHHVQHYYFSKPMVHTKPRSNPDNIYLIPIINIHILNLRTGIYNLTI